MRFGGLTSRVLVWMMLLAFVPMAIMTGQGYHCAREAILEETNEHLLSLATSRSALVSTWFAQRFSEIDVIASSPSVARCCAHFANLSEEDIDREATVMLRAVLGRVDSYDGIAVLGADGAVVARVSRDGTDTGDAGAYVRTGGILAADGEIEMLRPELDGNGNVVLFIGRHIQSGGSRQGLVVAKLNLTRGLEPLLHDRAGLGETGRTYLAWVDRSASSRAESKDAAHSVQILTEPLPNMDRVAMRRPLPDAIAARGLPGQVEHVEYTDERGKAVWARLAAVALFPMEVIVEQDVDEALAWIDVLLRRVAVTGAVTFLVILVVAVWTSRKLGEPLRVLARVAQNVTTGNAQDRVGPLSGTEAEDVRKAFNTMLDELAAQQRELVRTATLASVGELSSSIVHEMRNPLSSIKMNLQSLLRTVESDPGYRELADIAIAQVARLERMLNDLLQYGRPVEIRRQPMRFDDLARSAISLTVDQASKNRVRVVVEDELNDTALFVDSELMCRALTNLVLNGIEAAPQGGLVTVRGRRDADERAIVEVIDTGSGISSETLDQVFQPFFTTKPAGTGLGLANVRKIVELHGGSVTAGNGNGGGAVFAIRLPLTRENIA